MTIHTLRHIHDLLMEDEAKKDRMLKLAREARSAAEDEGDKVKLAKAKEEYEAMFDNHIAALRALQDFENHEF